MTEPLGRRPRDEGRFDEELRRAARSLITEELPRDVLDPAVSGSGRAFGGVTTRRTLPGFAGAVAAVVVLLLATAVALAPGGLQPNRTDALPATESLGMQISPSPAASPSSPFRSTSLLVADLNVLDYRCNDGQEIESPKPGPDAVVRESAVCTAPDSAGPLMGAVIIDEAKGGRVVFIYVKADIVGDDTAAAREAVADLVGMAASLGPWEKVDGAYLQDWVVAKLPTLTKNEGVELQARGYALRILRSSSGSYVLSMEGF